ncbi:MAG: amidase [Acidimicrobiia bacterium]|nr:amidase [Acidimicrobiia bacterium]
MSDADVCFMTAVELTRRLRAKEVSAREVMDAHLRQIERVNPKVNAIVTLVADRAREAARRADERIAKGEEVGPLHGLPVAHKDLQETKGIRTTYGSLIYKDHVPTFDALVVERLHAAGAITVGKTNTPEFGAGSQTFNAVFGRTMNPYDLTRTCGGSSGGAAVALACGMVPLADGGDAAASLRNPASFCNVVGLRPSPGRVPSWPYRTAWFPLKVDGPMARTVADVALMLSALAGPDPRSPIAITEDGARFRRPLGRDFKGVRVAWSRGLGLPFEPAVKTAVDAQRRVFEALGCIVEEADPDLTGADDVFKTLRAWYYEAALSEEYARHKDELKDTLVWNIEEGRRLTGPQVGRAEVLRTALYHRVREFLDRYEFFVLPVVQVLPFDVKTDWLREVNGVKMETYIDWMKSCYFISTVGNPAMSVPCAFSAEGLPIGLQIVGRHQDDWGVLQLGYAFEQATGLWKRKPPVAAA